jgi:hypothetical protein
MHQILHLPLIKIKLLLFNLYSICVLLHSFHLLTLNNIPMRGEEGGFDSFCAYLTFMRMSSKLS